jgi:predicted small metal-binding protein
MEKRTPLGVCSMFFPLWVHPVSCCAVVRRCGAKVSTGEVQSEIEKRVTRHSLNAKLVADIYDMATASFSTT